MRNVVESKCIISRVVSHVLLPCLQKKTVVVLGATGHGRARVSEEKGERRKVATRLVLGWSSTEASFGVIYTVEEWKVLTYRSGRHAGKLSVESSLKIILPPSLDLRPGANARKSAPTRRW